MSKIHKVFGPPGTGKTTYLINIVEQAMAEGIKPDKIGYFSFTCKAARVAQQRAIAKFNVSKHTLKYFQTLHSFAYNILNLSSGDVLNQQHVIKFAEKAGLDITTGALQEDSWHKASADERALFYWQYHIATGKGLEDCVTSPEEDINIRNIEYVGKALSEYKLVNGLYDFNDFLIKCSEDDVFVPELDLLLIDEAQDLTPLQWKLVDKLIKNSKKVYLVGDDDQAIYEWAGADSSRLLTHEGSTQVLKQSYRLPVNIWNEAMIVLEMIVSRQPKDWTADVKRTGSVRFIDSIYDLDLINNQWLFLSRNMNHLYALAKELKQIGHLYSLNGQSSIAPEVLLAVRAWETYRKDRQLSPETTKVLHRFVPPDKMEILKSKPWHEVLSIPAVNKSYIIAMLNNGYKLSEEPSIKLSTIHRAKGGECHNVVLVTDISRKVHSNLLYSPDSEYRVLYTGITRAKENLYVLNPITRMYYEW